jgi:hypothetical protein
MQQIAPYPEMFRLPDNTAFTVYGANQAHLDYQPLPSLKTPDGKVVSQWKPTEDELQRLIAGEPLTLIVWTFNRPLQPLCLAVGGVDLT